MKVYRKIFDVSAGSLFNFYFFTYMVDGIQECQRILSHTKEHHKLMVQTKHKLSLYWDILHELLQAPWVVAHYYGVSTQTPLMYIL